MQSITSYDTIWTYLGKFLIRCNLISAEEPFGIVWEIFAKDANETWLGKFYESLKNFSGECDWISSAQQLGPTLEVFGSNAIEFWVGHKLRNIWKILHKMQLSFGWDTNGSCPRNFSIGCNRISA